MQTKPYNISKKDHREFHVFIHKHEKLIAKFAHSKYKSKYLNIHYQITNRLQTPLEN